MEEYIALISYEAGLRGYDSGKGWLEDAGDFIKWAKQFHYLHKDEEFIEDYIEKISDFVSKKVWEG